MKPTINDMLMPKRLFDTMRKCCTSVRWKASVQKFDIDSLRWAATIRNQVRDGTYKTKGFRHFDIVERGKSRHIQSVHISERVVQKLLCNYALRPMIDPRLIYDNSASQVNKGIRFAITRFKEHMRWHYARHGKHGYILVMDFHDFFGSIPHDKCIEALCKYQNDSMIKKYISDFINAFSGDKGLGLGSEISQVCAIFYPGVLDKYIKEKLKIHCYGRYMDDSYIIHHDRKYLEHCLHQIIALVNTLGLVVNLKKTKIHNIASDHFVFLKKRVHITDNGKIILRPSMANIKAERLRIKSMYQEYQNSSMSLDSVLQSYQSWRSYVKQTNAYGVVGQMDKYFASYFGKIIFKETGMQRISFGKPSRNKSKEKQKNERYPKC